MSQVRNTEYNIEVNLLLIVCQSPAPVDLAAKMAAIYNELSVKVCNMQIKATINAKIVISGFLVSQFS
jgi:hypothetical protein